MAFDITPYIDKKPSEVRELIRQGVIDFPTAGMCRGYAQANLVILPPEYADDFEEYTKKNPFPCPVLEIIRGAPETHAMGEGGNIVTDIPRYRVYENGVFTKELTDASEYWKDGYVGFLIGCSFSFEEALMAAGIPVRHIEMGCNVPMYKTNIQTVKAGPFEGPMVCSMRPMTPEQAQVAYDITVKMPNVHGAPVQIGDPEKVGVLDVMKPDSRCPCSGPAASPPRRRWKTPSPPSSSPTPPATCSSPTFSTPSSTTIWRLRSTNKISISFSYQDPDPARGRRVPSFSWKKRRQKNFLRNCVSPLCFKGQVPDLSFFAEFERRPERGGRTARRSADRGAGRLCRTPILDSLYTISSNPAGSVCTFFMDFFRGPWYNEVLIGG